MRPCVLVPQNIRNLLQEYNKRLPLSLDEQIERAVNAKVLEVEGKNLTAVFTSHIGATLSNLPDDLRFQPPTLPFRYTARKDKVEVIPSQKQTHTARADLRKRWEPILREAGGSAEDAEMFFALTGLNAPATIDGTIEHIGKTLSGLLTEEGIRWTPSFSETTTPAFDFYIASTLKNYAGYIEELQRRGKATPLLENALPLIRAGAQRFERRYFSVAKQGREITKTTVSKTVFDKIDLDLAEEQFLSSIQPHLAKPASPLRSVLATHYGVAPDKAPLAFFIDVYEEQVRNLGGYVKYEEVKDTLFFRRLKWALHTALGNEYKNKSDEIELIAKSIIEGRPDPRVKVIYDYTPYTSAPAEVVDIEAVKVLSDIPDAYTNEGLREAYRKIEAVIGSNEEKDAIIGVLNLKRAELNIPYTDASDYIGTLADRVKDTSKLPNLSPSASKLVAENLAIAEDVAEQLLSQDKIRFEKYKQIQEARKYYEKREGLIKETETEITPTVKTEEPTPAVAEEVPSVVDEVITETPRAIEEQQAIEELRTVEEPVPSAKTAEELIEEEAITPEEFLKQADEGFNAPPPETPSVEDFPDEPREYLSFEEYTSGQSALLRDYLFEQRGLVQGNEEVLNLALNAVDAYFVSNGKFEEVMSALQSLTSTSLRASSEIEIQEKLQRNSRFLKIEDGVLTLKDPDALKGRIAELRAEVPILYFFGDETVAGYAIMEDFIGALADGNNRNVLEVLRDAIPYRVLNPNRIEEIPTITVALAGVMRTDDREKAIRGIEALLNRFTDEELNEMKRKLSEMVAVGTMSAIVRTAFDVVPILEFKDGRLTKDEFNALSDDAKRALLLRTVQNDDEWNFFSLNFTDDPVSLRNAVLQGTTTETVLRHPYLLDALMSYSREMGFSPIGLTAGAKIIRNHLDAMRRIFFHHKVPAPMKMMLEEYGGNALRLLYSELGTALRASGQREAEFLLRDVMQRSTPSARVSGEVVEEIDDDVFAFEVLKNLLGMPNDIDGMPALKKAINHATNIVFPLKALYQEAVSANIGEELIPLLSAFSEQGLLNQIISPVATGLSQVPLRPLLRRAYGEYAEDSMRFIVDSLDPHMRALYYTYQQAGRGHEFELYVPQIVADIIAKPDFLNAKNLLDALNNAFKSVLIVYNPPAILRNAFTNTMLLYHIGYDRALEMPFMKGVRAQLDAWDELKQGTQLIRDLEDLDPSLSLLRTYERLSEWEVINNFDARAVRVFRYISNLPFLRNLHYVQSMSEASAKVAAIKELLKARGKLDNYTREDLMQAITEVNEWLINYRVVPPAVHFLRKSLGLFPFITFTLTTMVNFARHPDRFMKEAFRATVYKERFSNVMGALFGEPTMQPLPQGSQRASLHALLPEYMRNNPLVVATSTGRDKLMVMDLSFWLPIGIFEQQTGLGMPVPIPQLAPFVALTNPQDTIKRYMGGVVRPFAELVLNKQLLTDTPIVDENLPMSEQMKQRGAFLIRNIPFLRLVFETAGVDELTPLGKTRTNEPIDKMTAWLGLRGYFISELEMNRLKTLEAKARDIQKAMSNLFKNPNLSSQRKAELFRTYQDELDKTLQEYEESQMYYVPMFFRADEENATLINSPAEFQSTVLGLFAKRRWESMDEFNSEMFQDLSVFDEPLFGEPMIEGAVNETEGE